MKIAYISSEIYPFAKTGGLADVAGSLPLALSKNGCEVKLFMPHYSVIDNKKFNIKKLNLPLPGIKMGNEDVKFSVYHCKLANSEVECYFIHNDNYYKREEIYTEDEDEADRFIFFSKAVMELIVALNWSPDILNVNDWQASLVSYYLNVKYSQNELFQNTRSVLTIHNIGYQGIFNKTKLTVADIQKELYYPGGPAEYYEDVNFLKLGILYSDLINTVSRTYAEEILTAEFGAGLQGVLLERRSEIFGILNGIDENVWDPKKDKFIKKKYSFDTIENKVENKKQLAKEMGFKFNAGTPVIAMVSRMATQKGFDILIDTFPYLLEENAVWVILGSGEEEYENFFRNAAIENPDKVFVHIGYNDKLAHLIEAGSDIFLMPSHYEPCGLNQMYSLKYGTVPVVRKTGGLADTVFDWDEMKAYGNYEGNGFSFEEYNGFALNDAVKRALQYFELKEVWRTLQNNGMSMDFSWNKSAIKYLALYRNALGKERQQVK
ncbi:MAG: glycogen synthase GlgA [Ignavibacteria bacterium]|nr:MAG: glycogen synthase GlgA [Ignavibacteria bacterium]